MLRSSMLRLGSLLHASCSQHVAAFPSVRALPSTACGVRAAGSTSSTWSAHVGNLYHQPETWSGFDQPIEKAVTLPASWYTSEDVLKLELQHVLGNSWQMVGHVGQLQQPGDFFCGTLGSVRYLVALGEDGSIRAFHNVCRHHAAAVAADCGNQQHFVCPYHGWTYDLQGRLRKATRLKGIQGFKASDNGLHPIACDTWGPWVFLHLGAPAAAKVSASSSSSSSCDAGPQGVAEWLGAGGSRLAALGVMDPLVHLARREYIIPCNWKVFADNYLDGGYHVPHAHPNLAGDLDLSGYTSELHEVLSIQRCAPTTSNTSSSSSDDEAPSSPSTAGSGQPAAGAGLQRLSGGRDAAYAFVYPNLMINCYGPWMDTNLVLPLTGRSVDRCRVVFDYWLQPDALAAAAAAAGAGGGGGSGRDGLQQQEQQQQEYRVLSKEPQVTAAMRSSFVSDSLSASHQVQVEDIALCEAVQAGLEEPAYGVGRYAPGVEGPMFHFHQQVYGAVMAAAPAR